MTGEPKVKIAGVVEVRVVSPRAAFVEALDRALADLRAGMLKEYDAL